MLIDKLDNVIGMSKSTQMARVVATCKPLSNQSKLPIFCVKLNSTDPFIKLNSTDPFTYLN